jgi:DNA polymerase III sliding clamp (beta) subunit (PCNA family)
MRIDTRELRNILSLLRPALNKRELAQQTSHFIFFKDKIAVFDTKICITHPFESDYVFSIKGEEFHRLINGISEDELTLTIDDKKTKAEIRTDSTSSTMKLLDEDQDKYSEKIKSLEKKMGKWKKLPKDFIEALSLCSFTTSTDLTEGVRTCICFKDDYAYSCDGHRVSRYKLSEPAEDDINVPIRAAIELIKFPVTEYCFSGEWLCFRTDEDVTFSCLAINGDFPFEKISKPFKELEELSTIELPEELKQTIDETLMLASEDTAFAGKIITLHLENNEILVTASNDLGNVSKRVSFDYEETPIDIKINSSFLYQILNKSTEMYIGEMIFFVTPNFQHFMVKRIG